MFNRWRRQRQVPTLESFDLAEMAKMFDWAVLRSQLIGLIWGGTCMSVAYVPWCAPVGLIAGIVLMWRYRFGERRKLLYRFSRTQRPREAVWLESTPKAMFIFVVCLVLTCAMLGWAG